MVTEFFKPSEQNRIFNKQGLVSQGEEGEEVEVVAAGACKPYKRELSLPAKSVNT